MSTITYHSTIPDNLRDIAAQHHDIYERSRHAPLCRYKCFAITAEHEGELCGLLCAYTCYDEVYVDDIIVFEEHRNKGIGRALLEEVASRYSRLGYDHISLVTSGFQAPEFYAKCGFQLEFMRSSRTSPALNKYFYIRYLSSLAN